jgi:hypothetical protein
MKSDRWAASGCAQLAGFLSQLPSTNAHPTKRMPPNDRLLTIAQLPVDKLSSHSISCWRPSVANYSVSWLAPNNKANRLSNVAQPNTFRRDRQLRRHNANVRISAADFSQRRLSLVMLQQHQDSVRYSGNSWTECGSSRRNARAPKWISRQHRQCNAASLFYVRRSQPILHSCLLLGSEHKR